MWGIAIGASVLQNELSHRLPAEFLASLEGGRYGLAFSSGSAVTSTILSALPPRSHIVSVNDVYGGSYRYFTKVASTAQGIETTFVEMGVDADVVEANLRAAVTKDTKVRLCPIFSCSESI